MGRLVYQEINFSVAKQKIMSLPLILYIPSRGDTRSYGTLWKAFSPNRKSIITAIEIVTSSLTKSIVCKTLNKGIPYSFCITE